MVGPPTDDILILASASAARRAMLQQAGVAFSVEVADVDEDALKQPGVDAANLAQDLARLKAVTVSRRNPEAWVLGADQTLAFQGRLISKAGSMQGAREVLSAMRGQVHSLHSGAALARGGEVFWSGIDTARMHMRAFSAAFLDVYLEQEAGGILGCVGSYRIEGLGAQLFDRIEGDHFTVLGLPLWLVLAQLRHRGVILA